MSAFYGKRWREEETPKYIENPKIYIAQGGFRAYRFDKENRKAKTLVGTFDTIANAQDFIKESIIKDPSLIASVHHWLIYFCDQDGEGHYQRWAADMHDVFGYDEQFAEACHKSSFDSSLSVKVSVDPPVGSIPDA